MIGITKKEIKFYSEGRKLNYTVYLNEKKYSTGKKEYWVYFDTKLGVDYTNCFDTLRKAKECIEEVIKEKQITVKTVGPTIRMFIPL